MAARVSSVAVDGMDVPVDRAVGTSVAEGIEPPTALHDESTHNSSIPINNFLIRLENSFQNLDVPCSIVYTEKKNRSCFPTIRST